MQAVISVYGAGYVGLVTATCLAELGHIVHCVDINAAKIRCLQSGECPIYEPGLLELITKNIQAEQLCFSTDVEKAAREGNYHFLAVPTPASETGAADLQYVLTAAQTLGQHIQANAIIINKSTVPVGTAKKVRAVIQTELIQRCEDISFYVVSNPEFLREGCAIDDFLNPDRVVIGTDDPFAEEAMRALYAPLQLEFDRVVCMDVASAELTKYAGNALLATKISFMNELSRIAEVTGADIEQVRQGIALDERIGPHFINPGCGYGGSCFPKDVQALAATAREYGINAHLLQTIHAVNEQQKQVLFEKLQQYFGDLQNKVIAVWGLAFKPNTDDIRAASSCTLLDALKNVGARVQAYDPQAMQNIREYYCDWADLQLATSAVEVLEGADVLVILTEWDEFKAPDFAYIKSMLQTPVIFDGRNLYEPTEVAAHDLQYYAIGRGLRLQGVCCES